MRFFRVALCVGMAGGLCQCEGAFNWGQSPVISSETVAGADVAGQITGDCPQLNVEESAELLASLDTAAEWNTYHGNAGLTGVAESRLGNELRPYWRFKAGGDVFNTPVVCGGHVFFANDQGKVFALDLRGRLVWSRELSIDPGPDRSPRKAYLDAPLVCFEGLLYVCDADGTIFALDCVTGEDRWKRDIDTPILGSVNWLPGGAFNRGQSPVISGESVAGADAAGQITGDCPQLNGNASLYIVGQDEGALHCLDAKTGAPFWVGEGLSRSDGSPGAGAGVVIFGSCDAALHVFSAATGAHKYDIAIDEDSQVASGVAIDGNDAFSGCRSGKVLHFDVPSGKLHWTVQPTDYEIFTTPAVTDEWVVIGAENGYFYGLERKTGKVRWEFDTRGTPMSPVIAGGNVVATSDGTLYVLSLEKGEQRWAHEVSDLISAPAVAGPLVLVGCDDGTVAAFYGKEIQGEAPGQSTT